MAAAFPAGSGPLTKSPKCRMANVRSGGLRINLCRDQPGKQVSKKTEVAFSCMVYDHPVVFSMANEDETEIASYVAGKNHWFFFELMVEPTKGTSRPVPVSEPVRVVIIVENPFRKMKSETVLDDVVSFGPNPRSKRETIFTAENRVAIRLIQKDGSWYVLGARVAIPREKQEGSKAADVHRSSAGNFAKLLEEPVKKEKATRGAPKKSVDVVPKGETEIVNEPAIEPKVILEKGVVGSDVYPAEGLRVTLRTIDGNPRKDAEESETGRGPGTVIWINEPEGDMKKGDLCKVLWDRTGLRRVYRSGYHDEFQLVIVENEEAEMDERALSRSDMAIRAKAKVMRDRVEYEKKKREGKLHTDIGGLDGLSPYVRASQATPSLQNIDSATILKTCFAIPFTTPYPPLPTPCLLGPRQDPKARSSNGKVPRVAIIGAGIAALSCARHLAPLNYSITIFEEKKAPGGRIAVSRLGGRLYNAGCSFFSSSSHVFQQELQLWADKDIVVPCHLGVAILLGKGHVASFDTSSAEPIEGFNELVRRTKSVMLMDRTSVAELQNAATARLSCGYFQHASLKFDRFTQLKTCKELALKLEKQKHDYKMERYKKQLAVDKLERELSLLENSDVQCSQKEKEIYSEDVNKAREALSDVQSRYQSVKTRLKQLQTEISAIGSGDAVAGHLVDILLEFSYSKDLRRKDLVYCVLPGFTTLKSKLDNQNITTSGESSTEFSSAEWVPESSTLCFRHNSKEIVVANSMVSVRLPVHLILPSEGVLRTTCSGIIISTNARAGRSSQHAIAVQLIDPNGSGVIDQPSCFAEGFRQNHPPGPCDGIPAHRVPTSHGYTHGFGPDEKWYMGTGKVSDIFRLMLPEQKVCTNERIKAVINVNGLHRVISEKAIEPKRHSRGGMRRKTAPLTSSTVESPEADRPSTSASKRLLRNVGEYDLVLMCTPPSVAAELCAGCCPLFSKIASNVSMLPCWVAVVALDAPLPVRFTAAVVNCGCQSALMWVSRESSRELRLQSRTFQPGRAEKMILHAGRPSTSFATREDSEDLWVLHSSTWWAQQHLDDDQRTVADVLYHEFLGLLGDTVVSDIKILDCQANLWPEAFSYPPPPTISSDIVEAKSCYTNIMHAPSKAGWGSFGVDGCLFDCVKGIGVAGDWMVDNSVEGAYLSGMSLAMRVMEAHSPYIPQDYSFAPGPVDSPLSHADIWQKGDWTQLDADQMELRHYWNGRPMTNSQPRTVLPLLTKAGGVGRPVSNRALEAESINWLSGPGLDIPESRPTTTIRSSGGEVDGTVFMNGSRSEKTSGPEHLLVESRVCSPDVYRSASAHGSRPPTRGVLKSSGDEPRIKRAPSSVQFSAKIQVES